MADPAAAGAGVPVGEPMGAAGAGVDPDLVTLLAAAMPHLNFNQVNQQVVFGRDQRQG